MTGIWRFIKGVFTATVMVILILFACIPIVVLVALKILSPTRSLKVRFTRALTCFAEWWVSLCRSAYVLIHRPTWFAELPPGLDHSKSYLVLCNHVCWADIPVLVMSINGYVPFVKFFMKKVMVALPILGWGAWGLDFPLLHRYSREKLEANPALRDHDASTLREFCERLKECPGAIIIFVEGTRFTPAKQQYQQSPYQHLLRPKSGGVGIVLENLGEEVQEYLDVTLTYADDTGLFWDFFCGGHKSQIKITCHPIPAELAKNYREDPDLARLETKAWIEKVWENKDIELAELRDSAAVTT